MESKNKIKVGPKMREAYLFVLRNPGCSKLPVARHVGPNGSTKYGYEVVNRAIKAGVIKIGAKNGNAYTLYAAVAPNEAKER